MSEIEKNKIYTIGYTSFNISKFVEVLKNNGITCLVDVRSSPFSGFYPEYNKNTLEVTLKNNNILHRNYIDEFGARQEDRAYYHREGYLDFNKFILSENFKSGVSKIEKGIDMGYTFCLMCAETDPLRCHRSIMVGRGLKESGLSVHHILKNEGIETHEQLEHRLMEIHNKNNDRNQLSLFSESKSHEELLQLAYDLQNKEIGFRKGDE